MKIYIVTDDNWLIIRSCQSKITDWKQITVTDDEFDLIQKQYDTIVTDWKIVSQTKGENATNLEISKAEEEQIQEKQSTQE